MTELKRKTLEHYARMTAWAESKVEEDVRKKRPNSLISLMAMRKGIGEAWTSEDCPLCTSTQGACAQCPIGQHVYNISGNPATKQDGCYFTPWMKFAECRTWKDWLYVARQEVEYLEQLDF